MLHGHLLLVLFSEKLAAGKLRHLVRWFSYVTTWTDTHLRKAFAISQWQQISVTSEPVAYW